MNWARRTKWTSVRDKWEAVELESNNNNNRRVDAENKADSDLLEVYTAPGWEGQTE